MTSSIAVAAEQELETSWKANLYLLVTSLFFLAMPTRVFIAISSDVIGIAAILVPFVVAFMVAILSIDITFDFPLDNGASEKIADNYAAFSKKLGDLLHYSVSLLVVSLFAKSVSIWWDAGGWIALVVTHFCAFTVGGLLALLIIKLGHVRHIFGFLAMGKELSLRARRTPKAPRSQEQDRAHGVASATVRKRT